MSDLKKNMLQKPGDPKIVPYFQSIRSVQNKWDWSKIFEANLDTVTKT